MDFSGGSLIKACVKKSVESKMHTRIEIRRSGGAFQRCSPGGPVVLSQLRYHDLRVALGAEGSWITRRTFTLAAEEQLKCQISSRAAAPDSSRGTW